jgi:hypothetical protein
MDRRTAVSAAFVFVVGWCFAPLTVLAQNASEDEYTRYELLDPAAAAFRIIYDVTATTVGARFFFNPIRPGSEASDESVIDLMTGSPLKFEVVTGARAREDGFGRADLQTSYIKVYLARPVPEDGGARIRILKTYKDPKSYVQEGNGIVFTRSLGIRRNSVVLPGGYELTACNVPSQIIEERDGRLMISFMNSYPSAAALTLRGTRITRTASSFEGAGQPSPGGAGLPPSREASADRRSLGEGGQAGPSDPPLRSTTPSERAFQDREIVYFLQQPETHAFRLYHDYTESREGIDRYVNVVRAGSRVSNPSAKVLDTGERLEVETLKGDAITKAKMDIGEAVRPESEAVVVRFPAVKKGQSVRIRIEETYTDPNRYALVGDELIWQRSFGRPRNDVVLPEGWFVTASAIPAVVTREDDGRVRLAFVNARPDSIDVYVKARRRSHR